MRERTWAKNMINWTARLSRTGVVLLSWAFYNEGWPFKFRIFKRPFSTSLLRTVVSDTCQISWDLSANLNLGTLNLSLNMVLDSFLDSIYWPSTTLTCLICCYAIITPLICHLEMLFLQAKFPTDKWITTFGEAVPWVPVWMNTTC